MYIHVWRSHRLYLKKDIVFLSLQTNFVLSNSADPDEILHYAAFHLGLHCLPSTHRAHPVTSHCSHLLLKCRVATNISHWLKVHSRWLQKLHIFEKVYFDQLLDFSILLLLFLHSLLVCHILLF